MKKSSYILFSSLFLFISIPTHSQFTATNGPYGGNVQALYCDTDNSIYAGTHIRGVFRTTDNGNTWVNINNGLTDVDVTCFANISGKIFCTTISGGLCYTTNSGQLWTRLNTGLPNFAFQCIYATGNTLLVGSAWDGGEFISTNGGDNWASFTVDTFANNVNGFYFFKNYYYAATPAHGLFRTNNVFNTWTPISPPQMWGANSFYSIGNTLYNCNGNGLYYSTDKGDTWIRVIGQPSGLGFHNTWGVVKVDNIFIAGTANGVCHSTDNSATWSDPDQNYMFDRLVFSVTNNNNYFFAGNDYNVWRMQIPIIGIEPVNNSVPEKYSLDQNYPNPFNPSTNIKFSIPKNSFTTVKVYNSLGEEISVLANQNLHAGNYEVKWDASNTSSGVYFYRIASGDFSQTKKMIVIK